MVRVPVLSVQITVAQPKRLDRRQSTNQHLARRHSLDADRERDRHDRGKALRYRGDCKRHRGHEDLQQGPAAKPSGHGHDADNGDADVEERLADAREPGLKRRDAFLGCAQEMRDSSELGAHSGRDHFGETGAGRHRRPHEHAVFSLGQRDVRRRAPRALVDRCAFTGQRGFVRAQGVSRVQTGVGGDHVSRFEHQEIAGNDRRRCHHDAMTVADDTGARCRHPAQRGDRPLGAVFLDEPDRRVDHDDGPDHGGIEPVGDDHRDGSGGKQQPDHRARELARQQRECRRSLFATDLVCAELRQALLGLSRGQSVGVNRAWSDQRSRHRQLPVKHGKTAANCGDEKRRSLGLL